MVKNPQFLWNGRDIPNFTLRPREAWANWLICVALQEIHGDAFTFAEDKKGDGILIDKRTGQWAHTEHIAAMDFAGKNTLPAGEQRLLQAIEKKVARGKEYAKGKFLVVFFDGAGVVHPNKVGRSMPKDHGYLGVFAVGHITSDASGYVYSVSELGPLHSPTYQVDINFDFTDWTVTKLQ